MFPSNIIQCNMERQHNTSCWIWIINIYYLQNNTECEVNWTRSIKQKISIIPLSRVFINSDEKVIGWLFCKLIAHRLFENNKKVL